MAAALPSVGEDAIAAAGRVHFDEAAVLIPDPIMQSRMPRLVKKSYSLPLWRKRSNSNPLVGVAETVEAPTSPTEEKGVVITVSVPSFSKSRSLTPSENVHQPLVPCIVNAGAATSRRAHVRRQSLTSSPRSDLITLPLRPCCVECYPITEESIKEGIEWKEKFTRGARRRRNSSADMLAHAHAQRHRSVQDDVPGFEAVVSVDEVDRRHRITGTTHDMSSYPSDDNSNDDDRVLLPSFTRRLHIPEPSGSSTKLSTGMAIAEADEDEAGGLSNTGFPLPSPRRMSSYGSPSASLSPLPEVPRDDNTPLLLQAMTDAIAVEEFLLLRTQRREPGAEGENGGDGEGGGGGARATVYYTPDSSPTIPALEPSSVASSPLDDMIPVTPSTPHPATALSRVVPIPVLQACSPTSTATEPAITRSCMRTGGTFTKLSALPSQFDSEGDFGYGMEHRPPSLAYDAPYMGNSPGSSPRASPALSASRKRGLHTAGSFFKAGAEMLKSSRKTEMKKDSWLLGEDDSPIRRGSADR